MILIDSDQTMKHHYNETCITFGNCIIFLQQKITCNLHHHLTLTADISFHGGLRRGFQENSNKPSPITNSNKWTIYLGKLSFKVIW